MSINGALIVNAGLKGEKFDLLYQTLINAASENGIALKQYDNVSARKILYCGDKPDFVLFWDKDIRLAEMLEASGLRLFNRARSIELCDNKALTYTALCNCGIKMPKTLPAPMVFYEYDMASSPFIDEAEALLGYPLVLKECFGSFGAQVYLISDRTQLLGTIASVGRSPFLLQEFIASSYGRDVRIEVVGGRMAAAMLRYSDSDFRANVTAGASMRAYNPTLAQLETALTAAKALNLDFCGVDIMFGENDAPVLCEVNSNAHINNISSCTGIDVADIIMKHIISELKD